MLGWVAIMAIARLHGYRITKANTIRTWHYLKKYVGAFLERPFRTDLLPKIRDFSSRMGSLMELGASFC
jgi:hypothetical protein